MKTLTMSIFLLLIFSTFVLRASAVQQFAAEPQSTEAVIGLEKVVLKCVVTNKIGELLWLKDSQILGSDKDPQLSGVPRYSIVGDANNGEYNLQIQDVLLEDDGEYECQVLAGTEGETLRSAPLAKLTVIRPPTSVSIDNAPTLSAVEGIPVELVCRGLEGNPAAEIKWYRDETVVQGAMDSSEPSQNDPTGKLHDAKSVLSIRPTLNDDEAVYTCHITNAALNEPYEVRIVLDVQYKPVVVIESSHQTVKENNEVIFNCVADANPDAMTYAWYRSDVIIEGASHAQLKKRITKNDNGVTFKCVATNAVGSGEGSIQLNVHFAPFFTTYPEDISVDFGEQAIIECAADGNPKPAIKWTRLSSRVTISTMNRLQFDTVKDSDVGMYVCTATVTGFEAEVHYARLDINSIPVIESKDVQCTELGSTAQINCFTDSKPDPMMIEWSWDDGDMRLETGTSSIDRFSTKKEGIKGGVRSILFIKDTAEEDFKEYNCTIWNEKGVSSLMITLKLCEMDMIIFIIIGVVSGSILILTLTLIVIISCKLRYNRRNKLTLNEEEEEKQSVEIIRRLSDYDLTNEEKESKYNKECDDSKGSPESTRSSHDRYAVPSKIMHKRRDSWDSYDRPPSRGMRYYNGPYSRRHFNDYVEPEYLPYRGRSRHDYGERPRDFPRHHENEKARDDYYNDSLHRNNRYNRRKDEYREREWKKKTEDIIETREAVDTISNHSNESEHNLATDV